MYWLCTVMVNKALDIKTYLKNGLCKSNLNTNGDEICRKMNKRISKSFKGKYSSRQLVYCFVQCALWQLQSKPIILHVCGKLVNW